VSSAAEIVEVLTARSQTLSVAESLTGGALTSEIVNVPGASHVLRGSIVAYSVDIKVRDLGVPRGLIDNEGVVSESVAVAMAEGVRSRM